MVVRVVSVVRIVARPKFAPDKFLVQARQKLGDGRMRDRYLLPAKKMHAGERPLDAATRALREELGGKSWKSRRSREELGASEITFEVLPGSLLSWYEMKDSRSYNNLPTQYRLSQVNAISCGLPAESFSTVDGATEHFWEWWTDAEAEARGNAQLRRRRPGSAVVHD